MSHKSLSALIILAFILVCTPVWAQLDETDESFSLSRDLTDEEELKAELEELEIWTPEIKRGDFGFSIMFGFLNLNKTLMSHDQIIYKWILKEVSWGDVEIIGSSSFNPSLRAGYNVTSWLAVEGMGGFSVGDYHSTAINRHYRSNEVGSIPYPNEPELGEYDTESRSLLTLQAGLNAIFYPLNLIGDSKGRFHPYFSGSVGRMWYSMNSRYSDATTSDMLYTAGGGFRLLVDKSVSIRFEVLLNRTTVQFVPNEYFEEFNEGTELVTIDEFPMIDDILHESRVTEYGAKTNTLTSWSVGVQLTF